MRLVIDSNMLQSEELRTYLAVSAENKAVLTDYAAKEAYKGATLVSIFKSMEIVSKHSSQVIVLKDTRTACGLTELESRPGQLIDEDQTAGFPDYCRHLDVARRGDRLIQAQILEHGRAADADLARMLADAPLFARGIEHIAMTYTAAELKALRTGAPYTEPMLDKLAINIMNFAAELFRGHPDVTRLPTPADLPGTFIFRAAVCGYRLALDWIEVGGATKVKPERIRNDLVDIYFAAFATYFDGLLTADKKLRRIHHDADFLLRSVFVLPAEALV
jgi:hypothetical protein